MNNSTGETFSLEQQLVGALADIKVKRAIINSAESAFNKNKAFVDLRRRLTDGFPNILRNLNQMLDYLEGRNESGFVPVLDRGTLIGAINLLKTLKEFLTVSPYLADGSENPNYHTQLVREGKDIFMELADGSIPELNPQSLIAIWSRGTDRLRWAFGTIRNAYLNRDLTTGLPVEERFGEYIRNHNLLEDVVGNYDLYSAQGKANRKEPADAAVRTFKKGFRKEIIKSMELNFADGDGDLQELNGVTAAQYCALYGADLKDLGPRGERAYQHCRAKYKTLGVNEIVSDKPYPINYDDPCTYFAYDREIQIQKILGDLLNFDKRGGKW
jgi:hypothetical protein